MSRVWELGKHDLFFSQTRERQRESSSEILLPRLLRFFFLIFDSSSLCSIHLPLLCSSSGSPSNLRFSFDGQKQAFVVVGRVSTGTEAKLKVLYGSGARKFARSCCSSWLTSHEGGGRKKKKVVTK
ncbi:uncharacterized protein LOC106424361 [Brassica napus]|uniref:uncharacterized protein LOC106424361 n=1 Tax=Brassica napus TaxID=3708 RepID=UPI0004F1B23F|nr:uncharacterized protein LOC106424361 [Brassica napus]XP_048594609.1 uncharacterized protein LOC106424361 [Brassica napus]XP_048594610.1 uncharacterized protein LOC106424361 [Brassica napus]